MYTLKIEAGKSYKTISGETALIEKKGMPFWVGSIEGVFDRAYEWMEDGSNVGDSGLDLVKEKIQAQSIFEIKIKDQEKFEEWEKVCHSAGNNEVWNCTLRWGYIMEQMINQGRTVEEIAQESAYESGLSDCSDGEWGITILFQCWTYGKALSNIRNYKRFCTDY